MSRAIILRGLAMMLLCAGGAGAAGGGDPAHAAATAPAPTTVEGLDVVAPARPKTPPSRAAVDSYVGALGVTAITGQLATWSRTALPSGPTALPAAAAESHGGDTICPVVMGLPAAHADFIVARIRKVGLALGAPMSARPCPPEANNLAIVFPDDAPRFIRELADHKPLAFGFRWHGELVQDLHRPILPIRAWYGVRTVATEPDFSRLTLSHQSVIFQVLIVVDRTKTGDIDMGQLSDYLAMISLAEVKPEKIPPTAASILNVFNDIAAGRPPAEGMTRMDAAYLQALYAIGSRQPGHQQNAQIAGRVFHDLASR
jgi:hypothetical protein